jgi:hypothetical protein
MEPVAGDDARGAALSAASEPYAWWSATPGMPVRRAVGVLDRITVMPWAWWTVIMQEHDGEQGYGAAVQDDHRHVR